MKLARLARIAVVSIVMAVGTLAVASPASAGTAPSGCTYIKQLGTTSYIIWNGAKAASVKQMYGTCSGVPKNWTYVWVWESFRTTHNNFWVDGVIIASNYGTWHGWRTGALNEREFNSLPVSTTTMCTHSYAELHHGRSYDFTNTDGAC